MRHLVTKALLSCTVAIALFTGCGAGHRMGTPPMGVALPAEEASPEVYRVKGESDAIRVLSAAWAEGQRDDWHSHPPLAAYLLTDVQGRVYEANGDTRNIAASAGATVLQGEVRAHIYKNVGPTTTRMVLFEYKQAPLPWTGATAPDAATASPGVYKVLKENDRFRLLLVTFEPGQRDAWHSHPENGVYLLTDLEGTVHVAGGESRPIRADAGTVIMQQPSAKHSFENRGSETARMLIFEVW